MANKTAPKGYFSPRSVSKGTLPIKLSRDGGI